jgi:hypothetical protein
MRAMARARQGQKRVLKKKGFRSCTWIKGPKQTQNKKNKTLKRLFGLASKDVFFGFPCVFCFLVLKCKNKKTCIFLFFEGLWLEKITKKKVFFGFCISKPKNEKTQGKPKKHLFRLNQKVSS